MNINTLLKIANTKTNFSILSMIHIDGNIATACNMEQTAQIKLPISFPEGLYSKEKVLLGLSGEVVTPDCRSSEYPDIVLPGGTEYSIKKEWLEITSKCISKDKSQYTLNGMLFDNQVIVAIDGRRLTAVYTGNEVGKESFIFSNISQFLPEMKNELTLRKLDNLAFFVDCEGWLSTPILNGKFPNYNMFIPNSYKYEIDCNFALIKTTIKKIMPFIDTESNKILFDFKKDKCIISCYNADKGEFVYEIPCNMTKLDSEAPAFVILGLNAILLSELIENENKLFINASTSPVKMEGNINGKKYIKIIMPMKTDIEGEIKYKTISKIKKAGFL